MWNGGSKVKSWWQLKKLAGRAAGLLFFLGVLTACNRPHPNPEIMDPIYLDLVRRAQEAEREYQEGLSKANAAHLAIQSSQVNTLDRQVAKKDWLQSRQKLPFLEERAKFLKIQAERRRVMSRLSYRLAFERGDAWPEPQEYEFYKAHRRLREAPQSWDHRVPSNIHRYSKSELFHVEP